MLTFYTKPNCELCNKVRDVLEEFGAEWKEVNILDEPEIFAKFRTKIPVIQYCNLLWYYEDYTHTPLVDWLRNHVKN
jgi:hypothetical protein